MMNHELNFQNIYFLQSVLEQGSGGHFYDFCFLLLVYKKEVFQRKYIIFSDFILCEILCDWMLANIH